MVKLLWLYGGVYLVVFILSINSINAQNLYTSTPYSTTKDSIMNFESFREKPANCLLIYIKPGSCPRCESVVSAFISYLQSVDKASYDKLKIGIIGNNIDKSIEWMNKSHIFAKNIFLDPNERFYSFFLNSSPHLDVPFLYKILEDGSVTFSESFLGMNMTQDYVVDILSKNTVIQTAKKPTITNKQEFRNNIYFDTVTKVLKLREQVWLRNSTEVKQSDLGNIYTLAFNPKSKNLAILGEELPEISVFNINGVLQQRLVASDAEYDYFYKGELSPQLYKKMKGIITKVIYNSIENLTDTSITISASLPRLTIDIVKDDTTIGYYNEYCAVEKSLVGNNVKIHHIFGLPESIVKRGFATSFGKVAITKSTIYYPMIKGWPVKGTQEIDTNNLLAKYNPFVDSFYADAPLFFAFDRKHNKGNVVGSLPPVFRDNKLGYFTYNPKWAFSKNNVFFYDGYSPYVYVYDVNYIALDSFQCMPSLPKPTFFKPSKSLASLRSFELDYHILSMSANDKHLIIILSYGNKVYVNAYSLKNKQSKIMLIKNADKNSVLTSISYQDGIWIAMVDKEEKASILRYTLIE